MKWERQREREIGGYNYVKPVERLTPARKAETKKMLDCCSYSDKNWKEKERGIGDIQSTASKA